MTLSPINLVFNKEISNENSTESINKSERRRRKEMALTFDPFNRTDKIEEEPLEDNKLMVVDYPGDTKIQINMSDILQNKSNLNF
jgi:hypothetical protein